MVNDAVRSTANRRRCRQSAHCATWEEITFQISRHHDGMLLLHRTLLKLDVFGSERVD